MGLSYYQCAYIILNVFRTYIIYRFMRIFYEERRGEAWTEWLGYIIYYLMITFTYLLNGVPIILLLANLTGLCGLGLLYKTTYPMRLVSALSIYFIFVVAESFIVLMTGFIRFEPFEQSPYSSVSGIFLIHIFTFLLEIFCEQCKNLKKGGSLPYSYWIALLLLPVTSLYILVQLLYFYEPKERVLLTIMGLLLLCNICVFYLIDLIVKQERERSKYLIEEKEVDSIRKQMVLLQSSSESIREIRHDLKNHLIAIQSFNVQNENMEIQKYINRLLQQGDMLQSYIHTGNITADGIMNLKLMEAKKLDIEVTTDVVMPIDIGVTPYDWTVILGNLLDNAIEASQSVSKGKRYIKVMIRYTKGMLLLRIENTYEGNLVFRDPSLGDLKTTKADKIAHGLGLKNVRETIKRYDGNLMLNVDGYAFSAEIILYVT